MAFKAFQISNNTGKADIKIVGSIGNWRNNSIEFIRQVDQLLASGVKDVDAYLNCFGGSMLHANEIKNQLGRFPGEKKATVGAIAASAGFTLLTAFNKENTWIHRNTQGMYHDPALDLTVEHLEDFDSNKDLYINLRNDVIESLAERMSLTTEVVEANMRKTTWLSYKDLIKYNIADKGNMVDGEAKLLTGTKNTLVNMGIELPNFLNSIDEADFENIDAPAPENTETDLNQNFDADMKELAKSLGLPENATAQQIQNAIEALQVKAKFGEEALVNEGVSKGLKKETLEKNVTNSFAVVQELVNSTEAPATPANDGGDGGVAEGGEGDGKEKPSNTRPSELLNLLKNELGVGGAKNDADKKLEDYTPEELDEMENKTPEKFEQLFKNSKYGKVKNPQD